MGPEAWQQLQEIEHLKACLLLIISDILYVKGIHVTLMCIRGVQYQTMIISHTFVLQISA